MEILVLLLLLRFGGCSKLLQDLAALAALVPPLPSLLSLPVAVPLPGWMSAAEQFHPPRAGLERPRAEGRGGAGLGRDVYSLCRRPDAPRRDRKSVVEGKSVDLGGRRIIKKKMTGLSCS